VMGGLGYGLFHWLIDAGWTEAAARNVLLLYMVLFENVHIGNCRSETDSAFRFAPWRSPFLLAGTLAAFSLHVAFMYLPFGQALLGVEPVDFKIFALLFALALPVLAAVEGHKWWEGRKGIRA
jgi:P-type Ca2+ transporter type 2C